MRKIFPGCCASARGADQNEAAREKERPFIHEDFPHRNPLAEGEGIMLRLNENQQSSRLELSQSLKCTITYEPGG